MTQEINKMSPIFIILLSIKNALISILNFSSLWATLNSEEIIANQNGSCQNFFNVRVPFLDFYCSQLYFMFFCFFSCSFENSRQ